MFVIGKSFSQIKVAIEKVSDSGKRFWVLFTHIILRLLLIHARCSFPSVLKTASLTENNTRLPVGGEEHLFLDEVHTYSNKMIANPLFRTDDVFN